jgi:hypothetical protein
MDTDERLAGLIPGATLSLIDDTIQPSTTTQLSLSPTKS